MSRARVRKRIVPRCSSCHRREVSSAAPSFLVLRGPTAVHARYCSGACFAIGLASLAVAAVEAVDKKAIVRAQRAAIAAQKRIRAAGERFARDIKMWERKRAKKAAKR